MVKAFALLERSKRTHNQQPTNRTPLTILKWTDSASVSQASKQHISPTVRLEKAHENFRHITLDAAVVVLDVVSSPT